MQRYMLSTTKTLDVVTVLRLENLKKLHAQSFCFDHVAVEVYASIAHSSEQCAT